MRNPLEPMELAALSDHYVDPAFDREDPPIDPDAPPDQRLPTFDECIEKYRRTFDWHSFRLKPGHQRPAALFYCKHLSLPTVFDVLAEMPESTRLKTVFLMSCHRVNIVGAAGAASELTCGPVRPYGFGVTGCPEVVPVDEAKWLKTIVDRFGLLTVRVIANLVYRAAIEPLPEGQLGPFVSPAG